MDAMKNKFYRTAVGQSTRIVVFVAMLLILAGCEQTAEPNSESVPATTEGKVPPKIETEKVVVDVPAFLDDAFNGKLESVRQAIDAGVDINATDDQQRTALMWASFNGHTSVVRLLLGQDASLTQRDATGRTALMFAATGANAESVEVLLEAGAEVNAVDAGERFTALMHAAAEGQ